RSSSSCDQSLRGRRHLRERPPAAVAEAVGVCFLGHLPASVAAPPLRLLKSDLQRWIGRRAPPTVLGNRSLLRLRGYDQEVGQAGLAGSGRRAVSLQNGILRQVDRPLQRASDLLAPPGFFQDHRYLFS